MKVRISLKEGGGGNLLSVSFSRCDLPLGSYLGFLETIFGTVASILWLLKNQYLEANLNIMHACVVVKLKDMHKHGWHEHLKEGVDLDDLGSYGNILLKLIYTGCSERRLIEH
jgi:hypothetical protein